MSGRAFGGPLGPETITYQRKLPFPERGDCRDDGSGSWGGCCGQVPQIRAECSQVRQIQKRLKNQRQSFD